ncbi:hypothetical protein F9U64_12110 [Gracilibacillus oryzae]|uniref:Uncharacterized protein n=1 Tax=Gracilibacillus oryzae TaxID=1672701 RepID=A0A7C8GSV5_9BACI|nr:hypothetical protein [Gracilibacillus oryzae]KAB8133639.1 hypothetical protein F9U64_12110 [Gracilibacillus oryzae]
MKQSYFILQADNFSEFQIAFGKVFWMYDDMITSYGGFGHNIDFEHIEYERFLFADTDAEMDIYQKQLEVVKQGSLVALGCEVVNLLDEEHRDDRVYNFITVALSHPTIEDLPFEKEVLLAMKKALDEALDVAWETLPYGSRLDDMLKEVYKRFVLQYFRDMLGEGKLS